jgi:hypothetical protein
MSNENDKFNHSKRLHQEESAIQRQKEILKNNHAPTEQKQFQEPHRMSKKHALNCGNPKCILCGNPRKMFKELTHQEKKMFQDLEQVRDTKSNGSKIQE